MEKQWTFRKLVGDNVNNQNVVGLLTYAIYKARKDALAISLQEQNLDQSEIDSRMQSFHDDVASSLETQKDYEERAKAMLAEVAREIETRIHADVNAKAIKREDKLRLEISNLKKLHKKELTKTSRLVRADLINKIDSAQIFPWWVNALKWIWNGFSGVLATILVAVISWGFIYYSASSEEKDMALKSFIERVYHAYQD